MVREKRQCPKCKDSGEDNLVIYEDGHAHCFSQDCGFHSNNFDEYEKKYLTSGKKCDKIYYSNTNSNTVSVQLSNTDGNNNYNNHYSNNNSNTIVPLTYPHRGLKKETLNHYDVNITSGVIEFPYSEKFSKYRRLNEKSFWSTGGSVKDTPLFGQQKFEIGSGKMITITEGEYDALSVYQMMGSKYPCVSVASSTQAEEHCRANFKYLDSFETIVICFDNDRAGKSAAVQVAKLFNPNKVRMVELTKYKDANDYLVNNESKSFVNAWWAAKKFLPKNVINSYEDIRKLLREEKEKPLCDFPFLTLQEMTYGILPGKLYLFTALEKVGKTEIIRTIEYKVLKDTDDNVAIIHLEEGEKRSALGLIGYELGVPCHLPDCTVDNDTMDKAYERLTKKDNRVHYYTHFGSDDPDQILSTIRYLVSVCKCKFVFLDHITMIVTGHEGDDERRKLDYISTQLAQMTRDLNFTLFLVSHVNDEGHTRGSRNISKVADLIVHLSRDTEAEDFATRNTTKLLVKGNRLTGLGGPAGNLRFDPGTFMLKELTLEELEKEREAQIAKDTVPF